MPLPNQRPATKDELGDPNWWRVNGLSSLAWFNANIMPFAWDDKFHDFGFMHQLICDHLDPNVNKNPQIYLSAFRGSHKSTQLLGYICWTFLCSLCKRQSNALVYETATKENTWNMQADVKHSLLHNEIIHWAFPEVPHDENAFDAMTKPRIEHRHVRLDFTSLETTLVSRHYPIWLNDDLENDENAKTEYMREELKKKWRYQKAILTKIKSRGIGLEIEVGTPYSVNGLTWMIRNLQHYSKLEIPCYKNGDKAQGVWFPELYSVEDFESKRAEMGASIFSAQYLLKPLSDEDALCPESWVRRWSTLPDLAWRSMVVDLGGSSPGSSDPTGITICDTDETGILYVVYGDEFWLTPDKIIDQVVRLVNIYKPDDLRFEKAGYAIMIADTMQRRYPEMNISFVEPRGRAKGDAKNRDVMNTRIWRLRQWFETHRILIGNNMPAFEDQLLHYPDVKHDDMLDSLAYHLDIRRIPKRKSRKIRLPSGLEVEPSIEETFDKEFDEFYAKKREPAIQKQRYFDAIF